MIIISSSLVLPSAETLPLTYPIIGWHNLVAIDTISSDTEQVDYPVSNLANPSTNLKWKGSADSPLGTEYITVDTSGYVDDIDYLAVAGHNFGTTGATVSVGYFDDSDSPPTWVELVEEQTLADDGPVIFRFEPQTLAEIKLKIEPASDDPEDTPEAAVVYVGKLLVMERGVQGFTPLPYGRAREIVTGTAEAGDFLGRIQIGGRSESSPSFIGLSPSWVRENLDDFLEDSATHPFFFGWNPQDYPAESGFAWMASEPRPVFDLDGYVSVQFDMTGILR